MRKSILLPALASLAACSSLTPIDDPVYLRITDLEARLLRIERVLQNDSLISLAGDIQALRNEVQTLLGEVETMRFETQNQAERQRNFNVDLDRRLTALEQAQQRLAQLPVQGGAPGQVAVNDQQAYDAAYQLILDQRYQDADAAFQRFLSAYPASPLRDNAQYWLAEMHYVRGSYATALREFQRVVEQYPDSDKLADALLKIGYCNFELRNMDAARQALQQVMQLYPNTNAASLAQERLALIARAPR